MLAHILVTPISRPRGPARRRTRERSKATAASVKAYGAHLVAGGRLGTRVESGESSCTRRGSCFFASVVGRRVGASS